MKKKAPKVKKRQKLADGESEVSAQEGAALAAAGIATASSFITPHVKSKSTETVVDRGAKGTAMGLQVGAMTGNPLGAAIGAGVGGAIGLTSALISNHERKMKERQEKARATDEANQSLFKLKTSTTDVFSTDESIYNSARVDGDSIVGLPGSGKVKFMAEGGKVKGPGGPKDDAIDTSLAEGSVVVPAENAEAAAMLRKQIFGESPEKKMKGGGKVPVSLSNGEHVFTPQEKDAIDMAVVANGGDPKAMWDKLIPNPSDGNELSGGSKEVAKAKQSREKAMDKDRKSKMINSTFKRKYGITLFEYDQGKRDDPRDVEVKPKEKMIYVGANSPNYGLKQGFEYPESIYNKAKEDYSKRKENQVKAGQDYYNRVFEETKKAKINLDGINKKYIDKYKEYGITGPEVFSMSRKQQEAQGMPREVIDKYWAEYNSAKQVYDQGINAGIYIKKELENGPERNYAAKQIAEGFLKNNKLGTIVTPNRNKKDAVAQELAQTNLNVNSPLDPNKDQSVAASVVPSTTAVTQTAVNNAARKKAGKSKTTVVTSALNDKPFVPGTGPRNDEKFQFEDFQQTPAEVARDISASDLKLAEVPKTVGSGTELNKELFKAEDEKKGFMSDINATDILSMGQVLAGLMTANKERPLDKPNPIFVNRVAVAIADAEKAKDEAQYGFGYKENKAIDSALEESRRQAMRDTVQISGGSGATTGMLRSISQDKNNAILQRAVEDQNIKRGKQQVAVQAGAQANEMAARLDARGREIFSDDKEAYYAEATAAGNLMQAGLENFFNSQDQKRIEKERAKREKNGVVLPK